MSSRRARGFSLIEMMVVVTLILIVLAFSIVAIQPALRQTHFDGRVQPDTDGDASSP